MMDTGNFFKTVLRAARDLLRPDILFHALWPPLLAFVCWSVVAWFAWQPAAAWVMAELPDWAWLNWLGPWLAHVVVFFIFAPLIYVSVLMLVAVFALPRMMTLMPSRRVKSTRSPLKGTTSTFARVPSASCTNATRSSVEKSVALPVSTATPTTTWSKSRAARRIRSV